MGGTSFLLLSCLGLAITSQAQDCTEPVGGPNMSLKDTDTVFTDGSQVTFVCDVGYMSAGGSRTITCTAGGWTRLSLRCERKNCGAFDEVENGHPEYPEGTEFGDELVIICNPGYRLVGRGQILCTDKGWDGRKPRCEVVTCDPPAPIDHGSFSPVEESYSYRSVVQYSCEKDFTLNGTNSISCSDDGTFHPAPPTCIKVQCEEPEIKDASWVSGSRPPYGHKASVTHKCNTGFKMNGQPTIVCNISSQWSPKLPTCEKVTCAPLSNVEHGSFSPVKEPYDYNDVVQFSCHKGFKLSGSNSVSCSDRGTFTPPPPTCIKVTCAQLSNVQHGSFDPVRESYDYNDVVQFSCHKGFKLSGSNSISCSDGGTFTPPPPTCIMVTCAPPPKVEHGSFSPDKKSYIYNDVVQYSCEEGFKLSGSNSVSCSDDGTFKHAPPTCTRIPTTPKTTTTTTTTTKSKEETGGGGKSNDGPGLGPGLIVVIVMAVILGAFGLGLCLVRCLFGWVPFGKKKGTNRTKPDTEAPKVEENELLPSQPQ